MNNPANNAPASARLPSRNRPRLTNRHADTGEADVLLNRQAKPADEVWTQADWEVLCHYLHNGNGNYQFVMGFRKDGQKHYAKSSKISANRSIPWAWRTITNQVSNSQRTAFVPYSQNTQGHSRWGCLDFDAHDGEHNRARSYAFSAFQFLLNIGLTVILEHTGGGWHVWCIADDFREVRAWTLFLRQVAKAIDAPIKPGICEIFPDDGKAKGVRSPGSWNPSTDALNGIFWENTSTLIKSLRRPIGKVNKPPEEHLPDTESNIYGKDALYPGWNTFWKDQFAITEKGARHLCLLGLVGQMFHQIGHDTALKIVKAQYHAARVSMQASQKAHIAEFSAMWRSMLESWQSSLSSTETLSFEGLKSDNERDGFRILHSFQRKAIQDGRGDFPIARNNFAARLGISFPGGGYVRDRLVAAGVIERTAHYVQYQAAARYRWLL